MGVQGLWELLAPVGRRVSVETLAGKKVAIDASIWMIQFMKAMRDEKGEMVRNAHLIGFFRRICKLLFLRTKPVFIFDGGTPALKRRTVMARRRQRENAKTKIRKTAEKLLLNHLKAMKLKELAEDIGNQKQKNDSKGKKVVLDQTDMTGNSSEMNVITGRYNQETLDELLAASLAAEEDGSLTGNASTSVGGIPSEEDDEDEDMILPVMHGKVDPAVLAALPPSMQLDLLVQMRERLMAENRQKYQKVKKAPAKFSELQIQAYLKTVAFRREIDEVQKSAAGRGVGGVQTSRIASESNREFIFSSSFTGDKQTLTSAGVEKNGDAQHQTLRKDPPSSDSLNCNLLAAQSISATGSGTDEPRRGFDDDVETYLDERGRVRVSRVRAMGIHMTRDLQRNLDLMKEIEQERMSENNGTNTEAIFNQKVQGVPGSFPEKNQILETSDEANDETISIHDGMDTLVQGQDHKIYEQSIRGNKTAMEISFFEDSSVNEGADGDDDLFARLVAGSSVMISSAENSPSGKKSCVPASDCEWEEGIIEEKVDSFSTDVKDKSQPSQVKGNISDESEVDWEEGVCDVRRNTSPCTIEHAKAVSRGGLEEEADFQEAIRRSLDDLIKDKSTDTPYANENFDIPREMFKQGTTIGFPHQVSTLENRGVGSLNFPMENDLQQSQILCEAAAGVENLDNMGSRNILRIKDSPERCLASSMAVKTDKMEALIDKSCEKCPVSSPGVLRQDTSEYRSLHVEAPHMEPVALIEAKGLHLTVEQCSDTSNEGGKNDCEAAPTFHLNETADHAISQEESSTEEVAIDIDVVQNLAEEKKSDIFSEEREYNMDKSAIKDNMEVQVEVSKAFLDEEMRILSQERTNLGDEQRKLERNAESVSSEMFAECQELLQMFGLPYIIAPMEAEAQCAYLELANLVDGVVTDDSDVFLFGAQSVYKNIFDDRKYVETYFMKDIKTELGLTREKLIRMALLLGSDYTEGVSGIGIVNAIEVVNAFPEQDGLREFREWLESPDPTILGKFDAQTGSSSKRRVSKVSNDDANCSKNNMERGCADNESVSHCHDDQQSVDYVENIKQIFMDKHRNVSKNWHIPSSFPSETVISAYASPRVDNSTEPFSWGKPDVLVLRKFCFEKFGWGNQKADELLLPVLKEYNKHETQLRLEAFYTFNERFAKIRSKRIKKAVKGIAGSRSFELMDDQPQEVSKTRKKRRVSNSGPEENKSENSNEKKDSVAGNESNTTEKSTSKQSRKRRIESEAVPSEVGHQEPPDQEEGRRNTKKRSSGNVRKRGRGRGRGGGRGRGKETPGVESTETSSSDGNDDNDEREVQVEKTEVMHAVRRSSRPRKPVKYTVNDLEIDGLSKSLDESDKRCGDEEVVEQEPYHDVVMSGDVAHGLGEMNQHNNGDPSEGGFRRDYLEIGGGFCLNEGEPENDKIQLVSSPTRASNYDDGEFLKMGAGFCLDEGVPDKGQVKLVSSPARVSRCQNIDPSHPSLEDGSSGDYLKAGGFCMEEGPVQLVSSPTRVSDGLLNGGRLDASDTNRSLDREGNDDPSGVSVNLQENLLECRKDDSGTTTTRGLSAMPFLRRKRRNS